MSGEAGAQLDSEDLPGRLFETSGRAMRNDMGES
jgi:hypothetical protein